MFGRFVLSFLLFFFCLIAHANQVGIVITDEAYIFVDPHFDSKVIAVRPKGEKLKMSSRKKNSFYRVKLLNGLS